MRVDSTTRDVGPARNKTIEERKRIERLKRVEKATKKENTKSVGYYETRGITKESKETGSTTTPQEEYKKDIAQMAKSPIYAKLQNQTKNKENQTKETQDKEVEQDGR